MKGTLLNSPFAVYVSPSISKLNSKNPSQKRVPASFVILEMVKVPEFTNAAFSLKLIMA